MVLAQRNPGFTDQVARWLIDPESGGQKGQGHLLDTSTIYATTIAIIIVRIRGPIRMALTQARKPWISLQSRIQMPNKP